MLSSKDTLNTIPKLSCSYSAFPLIFIYYILYFKNNVKSGTRVTVRVGSKQTHTPALSHTHTPKLTPPTPTYPTDKHTYTPGPS